MLNPSVAPKETRVAKGGLHEFNVFVNFIRFNVMLIHFMDIFAPSENL